MSVSVDVILLERVPNLGQMGDTVKVKAGYARNYLLPQERALRATENNLAYFNDQKKALEQKNEKTRKEAADKAKKLEGKTFAVIRQASEGGQLYGSVSARDIAEILAEETGVKVERYMVTLKTAFKTIGFFPVTVALHPEVEIDVKVNIARTADEAALQEKSGQALIQSDEPEMTLREQAEAIVEAQEEAEATEEEAVEAEAPEAEEEQEVEPTSKKD